MIPPVLILAGMLITYAPSTPPKIAVSVDVEDAHVELGGPLLVVLQSVVLVSQLPLPGISAPVPVPTQNKFAGTPNDELATVAIKNVNAIVQMEALRIPRILRNLFFILIEWFPIKL